MVLHKGEEGIRETIEWYIENEEWRNHIINND